MKEESTPLEQEAVEAFNSGFNCAQSVLKVYAGLLGFDRNMALSITSGFGSGMGRLQKTCGAVTGAYMVLSIYSSTRFTENSDRKECAISMIQDFHKKFLEKHNVTDCRTLLNCDLQTEEGEQQFYIDNLSETVCEVCIADSIKILNELIEE